MVCFSVGTSTCCFPSKIGSPVHEPGPLGWIPFHGEQTACRTERGLTWTVLASEVSRWSALPAEGGAEKC